MVASKNAKKGILFIIERITMTLSIFILRTMFKLADYIQFLMKTRSDIDALAEIKQEIQAVIDQLSE